MICAIPAAVSPAVVGVVEDASPVLPGALTAVVGPMPVARVSLSAMVVAAAFPLATAVAVVFPLATANLIVSVTEC